MFIYLRVCSLIAREQIYRFAKYWHAYSLRQAREHTRVKMTENNRVRFPVTAFPVARKLSTIEERRQDQSCLIW
jgi:hypothetical protein